MTKFKTLAISAAVVGSVGFASMVSAGSKANLSVLIATSPVVSAQGSLGTARASADTVQLIGCTVETTSWSGTSGTCSATNSAGTSVFCTSTDPDMIATMANVGNNSFIRFTTNTNGGECTTVRVVNSSQWLPLTP